MKKEKYDDVGEITCTNQPPSPSLEGCMYMKHVLATRKQPSPSTPVARWREKLFGRRGRKQINETAPSGTRSDRGCENVFTAC